MRATRVSRGCGRRRARAIRLWLWFIAATACALLLGSAPALALSQRGHVFSFSFGAEGKEAGEFVHPSGIAVDDATGDVYVSDQYNDRIEEFEPELSAGKLVGETPVAEVDVPDPQSVAVDNSCSLSATSGAECTARYPSNGDVYVVGRRSVRDPVELEEEAAVLRADEVELRAEAKQAKAEAKQLRKEAEKLTGVEREAKEREAVEEETREAKLASEAEEAKEKAKEDEEKGLPAKEREAEEAEEIKEEAADPEHFWVYKLGPEGTPIATLHGLHLGEEATAFAEEEEDLAGVAVNAGGRLFVYQKDGEIFEFNDAAKRNEGVATVQSHAAEAKAGFAVDANGDFYAGVEELVGGDELEEELTDQVVEEDEQAGLGAFALVAKLGGSTGDVEIPEIGAEDTIAVAVNPSASEGNDVSELNDVYVDDLTSVAGGDVTTVAAFNAGHELIQRFSAPGLENGDGVAVDANSGAVYVADGAADRVDVFELEPSARPTVSSLSAKRASTAPYATTLSAQLDPTGAASSYEFEYGLGSCASVPSPCRTTDETRIVAGFADESASAELPDSLAAGVYHYRVVASNEFGTVRSGEQTFSVPLAGGGLPDGRAWELVSPAEKDGAEPEVAGEAGGETQASAAGNAITYVANGPMPAGDEPEGNRAPEATQVISIRDASEGKWDSQDLSTANSKGTGIEVGWPQEYILFSSKLSLGLLQPFSASPKAGALAEPPLSPLLTGETGPQEKTIYLHDDTPIPPEEPEGRSYEEARANGVSMHNLGYLALVTELNAPGGEPFGGGGHASGIDAVSATPDLSHVVFKSYRAASGLYEWGSKGSCSSELYPLCTGGEVQPVSVLPVAQGGALVGAEADLGASEGKDFRHAISNDGALVFWTAEQHLYVRDTITEETLRLDASQPGAPRGGEHDTADAPDPVFQTASADGARVFFTDTQRLTADSKGGAFSQFEPDLYVAELSGGRAPASPLSMTLTDLTPEGRDGESAYVLAQARGGGVIGASEGGSYVYFVANGALAPDAARGYCSPEEEPRPAGTTCNLYMRHYTGAEWAPAKLIAALSLEDSPDWDGLAPGNLAYMTSRVSPSGEYLAFMSNRTLTGYDNIDVNEQEGPHADEEVFLYDASTEQLVCASCDPTGARPEGVHDLGAEDAGGSEAEGQGLVVDRQQIWAPTNGSETNDHWLAGSVPGWVPVETTGALYQPRYLLDDGRLFFDSPDHLVPAATGEKEKVYEYEPRGAGSCDNEAGCVALISAGASRPGSTEHESAFLDASESGNDVFFLTAEQLAPQDEDTFFDVYDAHVCESSSPCPSASTVTSSGCDGTAAAPCKGPQSSPPSFTAPASTVVSDAAEAVPRGGALPTKTTKRKPLTRRELFANALSKCRKLDHKKQRVTCELQARKKYGPRKPKKAGEGSRRGKRR